MVKDRTWLNEIKVSFLKLKRVRIVSVLKLLHFQAFKIVSKSSRLQTTRALVDFVSLPDFANTWHDLHILPQPSGKFNPIFDRASKKVPDQDKKSLIWPKKECRDRTYLLLDRARLRNCQIHDFTFLSFLDYAYLYPRSNLIKRFKIGKSG